MSPLQRLRHHVTGAIERGEAVAITEQRAAPATPMRVVFRKFPDGEVIALFCNSADYCNAGRVMSYMHVGQHGECARDLGRNLKLASPEEYAALQRELESIYQCKVVPVRRLVA